MHKIISQITAQIYSRLSCSMSQVRGMMHLMHLSAAIPGGINPGDIQNSAGFADFCLQFLARDGGFGPLLRFRSKIHGERPAGFVTSPLPWKWKVRTAGTGYYRWTAFKMATEKKVSVSYVSLVNLSPFVRHPSLTERKYFSKEIYDLFHANLLMFRCWIFIFSSVWIIHILLAIYIIVVLLKIMQEITLQFGIALKLCSPG